MSVFLLGLLLPYTAYKSGESPFVTFFSKIGVEGAGTIMNILKSHACVNQLDATDGRLRCRWSAGRETLPELHRRLVQEGIGLVSFAVKTDNLEDIYMRVSGHRTS